MKVLLKSNMFKPLKSKAHASVSLFLEFTFFFSAQYKISKLKRTITFQKWRLNAFLGQVRGKTWYNLNGYNNKKSHLGLIILQLKGSLHRL